MKSFKDNLRKIDPYVAGEQPKKGALKLNANENPYPPSPKVLEAIKNFDASNLKVYPDLKCLDLRTALADYHNLEVDNVFVGNGSDDVIALSFMSFFNSDKPIVFPNITYSFYEVWCELLNISYDKISLNDDFTINVLDYNEENGGVIIPNPNAPTSIGEGKEFLEKLLLNNKDVVVIIDEAYVDFGAYSAVELINKYENLLVVQTFSKSRSLAGLRIGAAFGSKTLIDTLDAVKNSYNSYALDAVALIAGGCSVKDDAYFKETIKKIIDTRTFVETELKNLGFDVLPSQTNFLFVTHKEKNAEEIFSYLKGNNVYIRYFSKKGIDNYLRITIGTDDEMNIFLENLKNYFLA